MELSFSCFVPQTTVNYLLFQAGKQVRQNLSLPSEVLSHGWREGEGQDSGNIGCFGRISKEGFLEEVIFRQKPEGYIGVGQQAFGENVFETENCLFLGLESNQD